MKNSIDFYKKEIAAGLTTFFTMSYIVVVNPSILAMPETGMSFNGVLTATVILCFLSTLLMGLYAKLPYGVAPGMGVNAFFAYSIILGKGVSWQAALGIVFWAGVIFMLVSVTPIRVMIANAIPTQLRTAAAVGIGVFISFIGLKNAGLIQSHPATLVQFGELNLQSVISLMGLVVIVYFMRKKNPFAFLIGIFLVTLIGFLMGDVKLPQSFFSVPDFSTTLFHLDISVIFELALLPVLIAIFFTDFFDSLATFMGVAEATGLKDSTGQPKNLKQGLIVDAFATLAAGPLGTSSGTAYIESAAGIEAGGRSGWTSVVTAICFLPCLFIAPLVAMVPAYATAPVLVLVGALMFKSLNKLSLNKLEEVIPAFLTIILIPLTFSITQGILWGFISHVVFYFIVGRKKELNLVLVILALLSLGLLVLEQFSK